MRGRAELLYLFSSNAQPQYAQDILNVLAAPIGHRMTFRYDSKYVDDAARDAWTKQELANEPVVVHFVLQQAHEYFTPVLFPVCTGTVGRHVPRGRHLSRESSQSEMSCR